MKKNALNTVDDALAAAGISRKEWNKLGEWEQNRWLEKGYNILDERKKK